LQSWHTFSSPRLSSSLPSWFLRDRLHPSGSTTTATPAPRPAASTSQLRCAKSAAATSLTAV
jgi:hypothetical protein